MSRAGTFLLRKRRWRCRLLLVLLPLILCQACALLDHQAAADADASAVPAQRFQFGDGGQAIFFSLDKYLTLEPAGEPETFIFVVSGSDCSSMQYFLPRYFRGLEGESGALRIYILHKRFIAAHSRSRSPTDCSRDFIRADHPSRWIADQTEFIVAQLASARRRGASPQRIVIAGISEGGDIVPILARTIPGVTHALIIANGGMNPLDAYRLQAEKHGLADARKTCAALEQVPADPDAPSSDMGGRSWRYWAELREIRHTENLAALTIPIWMVMGDADNAVPVESARHLRDQFLLLGKTNLTLRIYPGADHSLRAGKIDLLPDFWRGFDLMMRK